MLLQIRYGDLSALLLEAPITGEVACPIKMLSPGARAPIQANQLYSLSPTGMAPRCMFAANAARESPPTLPSPSSVTLQPRTPDSLS